MDDLLSRISTVLERQDFRMCVPPESDDTDIVLEECRDEILSLRQQLATALAACEAKDALVRPIAHNILVNPRRNAEEALAIKPDASAPLGLIEVKWVSKLACMYRWKEETPHA